MHPSSALAPRSTPVCVSTARSRSDAVSRGLVEYSRPSPSGQVLSALATLVLDGDELGAGGASASQIAQRVEHLPTGGACVCGAGGKRPQDHAV